MGMINVTLEGAVGQVRELRFMPDGTAAIDVSVAVTPRKKSQEGEWSDMATMWFTAKFWAKNAEKAAENVKVGDIMSVAGSLTMDEFERKDGTPGQAYNVRVNSWGIQPKYSKPIGAAVEEVEW